MIRSIHPVTDHDCILIELDNGEEYRLNGPRHKVLKNQFSSNLISVEVDGSLISRDPLGRRVSEGTSSIETIVSDNKIGEFVAIADNGVRIPLTATDLRTLLSSKH